MAVTEPIRSKEQLATLANFFLHKGQLRNYVMIVLGACTVLRISDLLRLRWEDVYDFDLKQFRTKIVLVEHKTGKEKIIAINSQAINALRFYFPKRHGTFIFSNGRKTDRPISRVQAWRVIHTAVIALGITDKIACHSLRKNVGLSCVDKREYLASSDYADIQP